MPLPARAIRGVAAKLNSRALEADSCQTDVCAYLSAILESNFPFENGNAESGIEDNSQIASGNLNMGLNDAAQPSCDNRQPIGANRQFIVPLFSEARLHDTIFDGARFSSDELGQAESIGKELCVKIPSTQVAAIIRRAALSESNSNNLTADSLPLSPEVNRQSASLPSLHSNQQIGGQSPLKSERKDKLRKQINQFANKLAHLTGGEYDGVHRRWIQEMNGKPNREATEDELKNKLRWLQDQISEVYCGGQSNGR